MRCRHKQPRRQGSDGVDADGADVPGGLERGSGRSRSVDAEGTGVGGSNQDGKAATASAPTASPKDLRWQGRTVSRFSYGRLPSWTQRQTARCEYTKMGRDAGPRSQASGNTGRAVETTALVCGRRVPSTKF